MCISLDLGRIWPDEVYVDEVYDHTKPSKVVCLLSMHAYIEYVVILIIYTTVVAIRNILKNMNSFEKFSHGKI